MRTSSFDFNYPTTGVLLVTFLSTAMEWFPKQRGLAAGVSALGSGFSGFIFSSIQSAFVNPWNYKPDHAPFEVRLMAFQA